MKYREYKVGEVYIKIIWIITEDENVLQYEKNDLSIIDPAMFWEKYSLEKTLVNDLGFDSLDLFEITMKLEVFLEEQKSDVVEITPQQMADAETLSDLFYLIYTRLTH